MWRLAKLSNTEFKALEKIIGEFNNDIAKLSLIQQSGQSPLIIARIRGSLKHDVFFTPNTFEILSDIESDLAQFNVSAIDQPHDIGNSNNLPFYMETGLPTIALQLKINTDYFRL